MNILKKININRKWREFDNQNPTIFENAKNKIENDTKIIENESKMIEDKRYWTENGRDWMENGWNWVENAFHLNLSQMLSI